VGRSANGEARPLTNASGRRPKSSSVSVCVAHACGVGKNASENVARSANEKHDLSSSAGPVIDTRTFIYMEDLAVRSTRARTANVHSDEVTRIKPWR
jgi:hypothetical protein